MLREPGTKPSNVVSVTAVEAMLNRLKKTSPLFQLLLLPANSQPEEAVPQVSIGEAQRTVRSMYAVEYASHQARLAKINTLAHAVGLKPGELRFGDLVRDASHHPTQ